MRTIYETLEFKNANGKYFNEYEVPDNLPVTAPFTWLSPTEGLLNPKFDWNKGEWVDDELESLKQRVKELETKLSQLETK